MKRDQGLRQRLQQEIRRYRSLAGLTQRDVAKAMDWSRSKVNRIESGTVALSTNDLRALLAYFGIEDTGTVNELIALAKASKRGCGIEAAGAPSIEAAYLAHEAAAAVIRQYEPALIPGLLQTDRYTRAVIAEAQLKEGGELTRLVQAQQERRQVLDRAEPPEMFFILDEAVLRRQVGSGEAMRQQVAHLAELGRRQNISIQIVPFARGAYHGLLGPFVVLDFTQDTSLLYLESRTGIKVIEDPEETSRYVDQFQQLQQKLATDPDLLDQALASATT